MLALLAAFLFAAPLSWADTDDEGYDGDHPAGTMTAPGQPGHGQSGMMAMMSAENLKQRLGLTDDQVAKIKEVRRNYLKDTVMQTAKVRVAELELNDLLDDQKLDAAKIEKKVKDMESLRGELTLMRVRSLLKAAEFLTPEQFDKFRAMTTRRMGEGMGHSGKTKREQTGPPGSSPHGGQGITPPPGMKPN
jgi:Spy/CpxP family protein refolding chaperone